VEEDEMAKHKQEDLFDVLRASGLRKKVARALSSSADKAGTTRSKALSASADNLREVAASLDKHAVDPKRSAAAKKAARTRKRNAASRGAAAKKGARTRAKSNSK
jgi:DNA topoisomerase-1